MQLRTGRRQARKGFEEALSIYKQLVAGNSDRFQSDVARVKDQLQTLKLADVLRQLEKLKH